MRRPGDFTIELNGSHGTLVFDSARLNELRYGSADDDAGLLRARVPAGTPQPPWPDARLASSDVVSA